MEALTGRGGAIEFEIELRIQMSQWGNKILTDKEVSEIRTKVESMDWKDGTYSIGSGGIKYLGVYGK